MQHVLIHNSILKIFCIHVYENLIAEINNDLLFVQVVQYKHQTRLEEKRKKALDLHLNFIVDQTEKYSTWLTEGLQKTSVAGSSAGSLTVTPDGSVDGGDGRCTCLF